MLHTGTRLWHISANPHTVTDTAASPHTITADRQQLMKLYEITMTHKGLVTA